MASATNDTVARAIEARRVPLTLLVPGDNPRRKMPEAKYVDEIAESMKAHDVIEPLIVRPKGEKLQIVCGATRLLAAMKAGLPDVPVVVRHYDDLQVLEVQLIENIQRASMHPIDEGEAFRKLITSKKHTAESLASTLGKSIRWVYQRIAFAEDLVPAVKDAFGKDEITSKHAEILIRLDKKDQPEALKHGCYVSDWFDGKSEKRLASTSELNAWIAENVERPAPIEQLQQQLPDVAEAQAVAEAKGAKVLQLVNSYLDAKHKAKLTGVLHPDQFKRAGGAEKCKFAERGVIVIGEGVGNVIDVCVNHECPKHWPKPAAAVAPRKQSATEKAEQSRRTKQHQTWQQQEARRLEHAKRWAATVQRAKPALLTALRNLKAVPHDLLRYALTESMPNGGGLGAVQKAMGSDPLKDVPKAIVIGLVVNRSFDYGEQRFRSIAKAAKFDLKPFEAKPQPKNKTATKKPAAKRKAGKKR